MTWRGPNDLERFVLRQPLDAGVLALARSLVLAPRIEPLLLRNARLAFLPAAGAELEARLWLSPLVAARSSAEIVLHLGVACVLAGGLQGVARCADAHPADGEDPALPDDPAAPPLHLDTVWAFTREHTRHWPAADRLERDLRYHALRGDDRALAQGLGSLLAEIAREEDEARRISLSRLAKRTLPSIRRRLGAAGDARARQLARYAALALQDGGGWSDAAGAPAALPRWLAERLPPPLAQADLGVEVRGDAANPVLHLTDPAAGAPVIALPSPLPARLHVRTGSADGAWHSITRGTCIPLDPPGTLVELTTLAGRRWLLQAELPGADAADGQAAQAPPPLRLVHAAADETAAKAIADWLREQRIPVDLVAETEPGRIAPPADQARAVRLWTRAARALWAEAGTEPPAHDAGGLLLRTEDVALPGPGSAAGPLLDWMDWRQLAESPAAAELAEAIARWWREGALPVAGEAGEAEAPAAGVTAAGESAADADAALAEEIRRLLAEIDEASMPPAAPHGVGEPQRIRPDPLYPPDIQALLDEIDDPATSSKRRLTIGDVLDELDDPRPGVGILADGLPDIDWIEIPGGRMRTPWGAEIHMQRFWISRYPVTNKQFWSFVEHGGYEAEHWWGEWVPPEPPSREPAFGNRPIVSVHWEECVAFCNWFSEQIHALTGSVRLPTTFEWERAARGEKEIAYPWGDSYLWGYANVEETGHYEQDSRATYLEEVTAVGVYPHGRSIFGVEDMCGTVWEWCLDELIDSETRGKTYLSALRGGSWRATPRLARIDHRDDHLPGRSIDRGFRVTCSLEAYQLSRRPSRRLPPSRGRW